MINAHFWKNKKIFLTGHTGFKGSWLSLWLHEMEAKVTGFALEPASDPSLFKLCNIDSMIHSIIGDIRDLELLSTAMRESDPDIVIHMAAQPLVLQSYQDPVGTYSTNVMGTVHVLESARNCSNLKAIINVTTDKCYESKEWVWGYRENDNLGGYDPYSNSKACSELVTSAYCNSFFPPERYEHHGIAIASARAGNVIGGGDWSQNRLLPDCVRSLLNQEPIVIRHPRSVRPWQHVLEPLSGYLTLAERLYHEGPQFNGAWNFGPEEKDARSVEWVVKALCQKWGKHSSFQLDKTIHPHETTYLKLDCSKAKSYLQWQPRWNLDKALDSIIEWMSAYREAPQEIGNVCVNQIHEYMNIEGGCS